MVAKSSQMFGELRSSTENEVSKSENFRRVGIVGGGSTGVSCLVQMVRSLLSNPSKSEFAITLFDNSAEIGPGLAYGAKDHSLLLNTPMTIFSILADNPRHFLDWLLENPQKWRSEFPEIGEVNESSWLPRKLAGIYLKDMAAWAISAAKDVGISVEVVQKEVLDIQEQNFASHIITMDGCSYLSDCIALCTGNLPGENFHYLEKHSNYIPSPAIHENLLKFIPKDSSVLIVGTSLSAIDSVMLLKSQNHTGPITMASRRGILPTVTSDLKRDNLMKFLTTKTMNCQLEVSNDLLTVDHLLDAVTAELSDIYNEEVKNEDFLQIPDNPQYSLKQDLVEAKANVTYWQKIMLPFFTMIDKYWTNFSLDEKQRYIREYYHVMQRYTGSFPPCNAEKVLAMLEFGQLVIQQGLEDIRFDHDTGKFIAAGSKGNGSFDYVINATGIGKNVWKSQSKLYDNLLNSNSIVLNAFNNIDVSVDNYSVKSNVLSAKIYAAGPPTFGTIFFTNLLYSGAKQSAVIVKDILESQKTDVMPEMVRPSPEMFQRLDSSCGIELAAVEVGGQPGRIQRSTSSASVG